MTVESYELILISDGCTDAALAVAEALLDGSAAWPDCGPVGPTGALAMANTTQLWLMGEPGPQGELGRRCYYAELRARQQLTRVRFIEVQPVGIHVRQWKGGAWTE